MVLKAWNGIYGCCSFEIEYFGFRDINEAIEYYKQIWPYVWIEKDGDKND